MPDLTFSSFAQGPLGEAIKAVENMGTLPTPAFAPSVTLTGPGGQDQVAPDFGMRLLGPGDVWKLQHGAVVRTDPPEGATDVEPNYLAVVEVTPVELPWVMTPARAAGGRLRPWMVLVVLEASTTVVVNSSPLPYVEADVAQLPDLSDSWGWAHVQRSSGAGPLAGGAEASPVDCARLVCPRRLSAGVRYLACLVPAFGSGVAAALGDRLAAEQPHAPAWDVAAGGTVKLPVFHHWAFTTGPGGDFEKLVSRLRTADPDLLRVSSAREVDISSPWPGDTALSDTAHFVGVQGALAPFTDPPVPEPAADPAVVAELQRRLTAQLDAPAQRVLRGHSTDVSGAFAPPLYGARHISQDLAAGGPAWLAQLNTSVANRIAAGLGADYVRAHQEELMARAWEQVGAIREANRLRATVELTTAVAERAHERHVASLEPGELVTFASSAQVRTRTSQATTLAMELRMSRLVDGTASPAFARRVRPAGKLARRFGVGVKQVVPRALAGEVSVPAGAMLIPVAAPVNDAGVAAVPSHVAARQLVLMSAMASVAAVNDLSGGDELQNRIHGLGLGEEVSTMLAAGSVQSVAGAIQTDVRSVAAATSQILADMATDPGLGAMSSFGVPIEATRLAGRISDALKPRDSHWIRLASRASVPERLHAAGVAGTVMACPSFPLPTALTLLELNPEWFLPGLGALPMNKVALLQQNEPFIESYLVGINHELMRELLWREYPTDQRGTPFTHFWPRPDRAPDIDPLHTWTAPALLGSHLLQTQTLAVVLVRGEVLRRYPGMVVTAVPSVQVEPGRHRPAPGASPKVPSFVIRIDEATNAYAFEIPEVQLRTPASTDAPCWFFVFAEHSFRIRFGFDEPPEAGEEYTFDDWSDAVWPTQEGVPQEGAVPQVRGHAFAGLPFTPPAPGTASWDKDAADIARITLQKPYRVAVQADVLLQPTADER